MKRPWSGVGKPFVSKAIYGVMTVLAVLVVMEDHPPGALSGAVTLFGTTLAVALVDAYSETIAGIILQERNLSRVELREIWHDVQPVLIGSQGPTIALLLSSLGLFSVNRAIDIAVIVAFFSLFVYGVQVGAILHQQWLRKLLSGLFLVAIGALIVGFKALFH